MVIWPITCALTGEQIQSLKMPLIPPNYRQKIHTIYDKPSASPLHIKYSNANSENSRNNLRWIQILTHLQYKILSSSLMLESLLNILPNIYEHYLNKNTNEILIFKQHAPKIILTKLILLINWNYYFKGFFSTNICKLFHT